MGRRGSYKEVCVCVYRFHCALRGGVPAALACRLLCRDMHVNRTRALTGFIQMGGDPHWLSPYETGNPQTNGYG